MTTLIIEDETETLYKTDFPDNFVDMHHPDDYMPLRDPISELIFHRRTDHSRLFLRICIKITDTNYIPITFVLDTGAPSQLYINDLTRRLIRDRIKYNSDTGIDFLKINKKTFIVKPSPEHHPDVNIIGLLGLSNFEFYLSGGEFGFHNLPDYF